MTDAPTTPDPIEMAMTAEAHDGAPDSPARTLLVNQNRLVLWEIADRRGALALKVLMALAGLAVAASIGLALWDASQARGLVIEAFSTPPDLAAKGLTGEVAAAQVVDRLGAIEATADSVRPAETYSANSGADLKVEIPQTGVSLEAAQRLLRRWLGRQTRVSGEIYRDGGALKLTIRMGGAPGVSVTGSDAGLDGLFTAGAEAMMRQAEPYRYALVLLNGNRPTEARAVLESVLRSGPRQERAWAQLLIAGAEPTIPAQERQIVEATRIAPELPQVWYIKADFAQSAGRVEAVRADYREMARRAAAWRSPDGRSLGARAFWAQVPRLIEPQFSGDYRLSYETWTAAEGLPDKIARERVLHRARLLALMHRPSAGESLLLTTRNDAEVILQYRPSPPLCLPHLAIARARQDWSAMAANALALEALAAQSAKIRGANPNERRAVLVDAYPPHAEALAHLGRVAEAQALIAQTPGDCYPCLIVRGQVAALAGDPAGADRWFAEAVRQAPSFAFAQTEWGRVKLARGDPAGALALARAAAKLAPRYADLPELEGEARLAQGDARGALRAFAAADRLAPEWGRLHLKWGEALAKLSKTDDAKVQWRTAAGLDLTATERADLARLPR